MDMIDRYLCEEQISNRYSQHVSLKNCTQVQIYLNYQTIRSYENNISKLHICQVKIIYQLNNKFQEFITMKPILTVNFDHIKLCVYSINELIDISGSPHTTIQKKLSIYYDLNNWSKKVAWKHKQGFIVIICDI